MYVKDINRLRRQINRVCNKAINEIITQLIANEDAHKVDQNDPHASLRATALDIKFHLMVEDKDGKLKPFQMYCNPTSDLK